MPKVLVTFFCVILISAYSLYGQNYHFQNYSLEEGLPQSQVWDMLQDSRGSLWLGTNGGGLVRFNGNKFDVFRKTDGLPGEQIFNLHEDKQGRIWIRTYQNGISLYDGLEFNNIEIDGHNNYFLASNQFLSDKYGNVWFTLFIEGHNDENGEIRLYKYANDSLICFSDQFDELEGKQLSNRFFLKDNEIIIIGGDSTIYEINGNQISESDFQDIIFQDNSIYVPVYTDKRGNIWFVSQTKGEALINFIYSNGELHPVELPEDIVLGGGFPFHEDSEGNFWFADNEKQEVYYWENEPDELKFKTFSRINGLPDMFIRDIMEDSEGNVWFATDGSGLYRLGGNRFLTFSNSPEINDKFIWSILQDSNDNYLFGTAGDGLILYNGEKFFDLSILQKEFTGIIMAIVEKEAGLYLLGTNQGLFEFDGEAIYRVNKEYQLPMNAEVHSILADDDVLWFATVRHGVFRFAEAEITQFSTHNSNIISNYIDYILSDSNGDIWVSGRNGVGKFEGDKFINYTKENGLPDYSILQITEDHFGRIWAATYGAGIVCIDPSQSEKPVTIQLNTKDGTSSDNIYSIITDNNGNIWAGGQFGVDRVSFKENGTIAELRTFDKYEGFIGIENNAKANLVDKDGRLWFGTINGVMVYNPEQDRKNLTPPVTNITDIKLSYREIDWTDEENKKSNSGLKPWFHTPIDLTLPYNKNHVSFDFEGLSYRVPEKVRYQWMLEGIDEGWSPVSSKNDAIYSSLPPGDYTFKVKASNNDGVWNDTPTEYTFTIKSPFWATWWFRSAVVLFLVTVFLIIFWLRNKFIRERQEELEHLVDFKTKKLQDQKDEILTQSEKLKVAYDNLAILSRLGRDITANLTVEAIINAVYEKLNTLMDAAVLGIGIFNKEKNTLDFPGLIEKGKRLQHASVPFDDDQRLGVVCLKQNKEIIINNYAEEYKQHVDEWKPPVKGDDTASIIFIPLIHHEKPLGVVTVQSFQVNAFNEYHLNIIRNLAIYAKIALENARVYEKIKDQTVRLTDANKNVMKQKDEIELKNLELLDLNNDKNHIISLVAHDLRNPLTSAMTMAGVLDMDSKNLSEDQKQCIKVIEKGLIRMNDMIVRILDVRRIESQKLDLNMQKVDLQGIIAEVNNNLKSETKRKNIKVRIKAEEIYATLDKDFATQVFENLFSNAIKFSPPKKSVEIKLLKENGKARAEIKDEGPGLTKDDMKKLFGKFQRLSAKPTGGEHSTGIGLSIVKKYVEAMNGKVWCESEPGKGANFIVEFDRAD
ncbi:two-component regulator propeller domain-containing protein [Bacteroidota bacterium]